MKNNEYNLLKITFVCVWLQMVDDVQHKNFPDKITNFLFTKTKQFLHIDNNYSLEFASPTMLSICRSSLNLSSTVPLTASFLPWTTPWVTPQHSITSGTIRLVLERQGLPNVEHENVCPWSKFAEINNPKWFSRPPKPMPFGISSELKLTAHYKTYGH